MLPLAADAPVVWVQAGHEAPGEPGYRAQGGAGSGPFGGEARFTVRLARQVERRLRRAGVDARHTPARVTPNGARGAVFVSLHHDAPGGAAVIGHAVTGAGENHYRGEGFGLPRSTPYPGATPHRRATTVSRAVERRSRALATRLARRYGPLARRDPGFRSGFRGVAHRDANRRVTRYYGFYRTRAEARVIVEAGAAGADDAFLRRTDRIAAAVSAGILDHLRAEAMGPPQPAAATTVQGTTRWPVTRSAST